MEPHIKIMLKDGFSGFFIHNYLSIVFVKIFLFVLNCFDNFFYHLSTNGEIWTILEEENGLSISIMSAPPCICRGHTQVISHLSFSIPQQF